MKTLIEIFGYTLGGGSVIQETSTRSLRCPDLRRYSHALDSAGMVGVGL